MEIAQHQMKPIHLTVLGKRGGGGGGGGGKLKGKNASEDVSVENYDEVAKLRVSVVVVSFFQSVRT